MALVLILSLLVSVLAGTSLIQNETRELMVRGDTVTNNTTVVNADANFTINSPESKVYNTDNVTVAFTINTTLPVGFAGVVCEFLGYGCLLDSSSDYFSKTNGDCYSSNVDDALSRYGNGYLCSANLTNLSEGPHNITAWVQEEINYISWYGTDGFAFSTVSFTVDLPPNILILSPETKVYNTSDVPLDLTVNKTVSRITYSLDGGKNVTIAGNATLTGLANGDHYMTVYATDEAGNVGTSQTIHFTIDTFPNRNCRCCFRGNSCGCCFC